MLVDERATLDVNAADEIAGEFMTDAIGEGDVAKQLKAAADARESDAHAALGHLKAAEERTKAAIDRRTAAQNAVQAEVARGYMARSRALDAILRESSALRRDYFLLLGFLIALDLVPVLLKALLLGGPYARRVAIQE